MSKPRRKRQPSIAPPGWHVGLCDWCGIRHPLDAEILRYECGNGHKWCEVWPAVIDKATSPCRECAPWFTPTQHQKARSDSESPT